MTHKNIAIILTGMTVSSAIFVWILSSLPITTVIGVMVGAPILWAFRPQNTSQIKIWKWFWMATILMLLASLILVFSHAMTFQPDDRLHFLEVVAGFVAIPGAYQISSAMAPTTSLGKCVWFPFRQMSLEEFTEKLVYIADFKKPVKILVQLDHSGHSFSLSSKHISVSDNKKLNKKTAAIITNTLLPKAFNTCRERPGDPLADLFQEEVVLQPLSAHRKAMIYKKWFSKVENKPHTTPQTN